MMDQRRRCPRERANVFDAFEPEWLFMPERLALRPERALSPPGLDVRPWTTDGCRTALCVGAGRAIRRSRPRDEPERLMRSGALRAGMDGVLSIARALCRVFICRTLDDGFRRDIPRPNASLLAASLRLLSDASRTCGALIADGMSFTFGRSRIFTRSRGIDETAKREFSRPTPACARLMSLSLISIVLADFRPAKEALRDLSIRSASRALLNSSHFLRCCPMLSRRREA